MTNRYHLPIVITTTDELNREKAIEYVERVLANLEETDDVYRTYVEDTSIDEGDAERLLDMLNRVDDDNIAAALDGIDLVTEDENEGNA